jgi:1-acyl-sn-glycerol-3-phosphate acyltransferase
MSTTVQSHSCDAPAEFPRKTTGRTLFVVAALAVLTMMTTVAMSVVSVCTLFRSRRFCSEVLARWLGRMVLRVSGIRLEIHGEMPRYEGQVIYLINHTSTVDVFVLLALGLSRTRFFLWGGLRKFPPVAVIGYLIGVFFTPSQARPDKRVRCFQNAERVLRATGDSVLLSPEGRCVTTGELGQFNKGAFHLATNLKAPIIPIFISIPRHINPGRGYGALPGAVHVHFKEQIVTSHWMLEDLVRNKEVIRNRYVEWHRGLSLS